MNVSEITNERLKILSLGREQASYEETARFAKSELDKRKSGWIGTAGDELDAMLDKRKGGGDKRECLDCEHQTVPLHEEPCCLCTRTSYHAYWKAKSHAPVAEAGELITEAEYLAKTKGECDVLIEKIMDAVPPANPKPVTFAIEGIPATAGECAAFIQGVQLGKEAAKPEQVESERALESDLQALIDLHISLNNRMNHLKKYINELKTQRAINELKKERAG